MTGQYAHTILSLIHIFITITPKGERAIVDGHPWVYEGEVVSISGTPEDGGLVDVVSKKGSWLRCV